VRIAIPLFDKLTALDAVGPYEVLQRLPGVTVHFIGKEVGPVRTENGFLGLIIDHTYDEIPNPEVIVVPGGIGSRAITADDPMISWLQAAHSTTLFTTSVCTGALILAEAGLLNGLSATTHWGAYDELAKRGAEPTGTRVVEHLDERIITAAGVSAGIDMALRLSELLVDDIAAQAMQLELEYDPQPPFDAGALTKAFPDVKERLMEYLQEKN